MAGQDTVAKMKSAVAGYLQYFWATEFTLYIAAIW